MGSSVSWIRRGVFVALLFAGPAPLFAQETGTVSGTVFGAVTERPVAGVRVQVLGTVLAATSGPDGKYAIRGVPVGTHTIRASGIGYARMDTSATLAAGAVAAIDFRLTTAAVNLEEVVVTGTPGAQEKVTLGNTVGQIQVAQDLKDAPISNLNEVLTARVPGLTLASNSGQAGSSANIRIRGAGSLSGGYAPVFYVDGVRIESGVVEGRARSRAAPRLISWIRTTSRASRTFKDPAAATMYGANAANGIIQIITKKATAAPKGVQWTASAELARANGRATSAPTPPTGGARARTRTTRSRTGRRGWRVP